MGTRRGLSTHVVADSNSKRRVFIEIVATLTRKRAGVVTVKDDRVREWLSKGAKPTLTVSQLLKKKGIPLKG